MDLHSTLIGINYVFVDPITGTETQMIEILEPSKNHVT